MDMHYLYKEEKHKLYVLKRTHILNPAPACEGMLRRQEEVDSGAPHPINDHHGPVRIASKQAFTSVISSEPPHMTVWNYLVRFAQG